MTGQTIGAIMAGQIMAMDPVMARQFLAAPWPSGAAVEMPPRGPDMVAGVDIKVERGQRYVAARGVAVLPVHGLLTPNSEFLERFLGWATYAGIEAAAAEIAADESVTAVVMDIDSPGGMVMGLGAAVQAVAALAAVKPVYALACPLAASAAYAIASQAGEITMAPGSYVGSIGVMRQSVAPVQAGSNGDLWNVHVSGHARAKWADPRTEAGRAEIQRGLDEAEAELLADVARGRGLSTDDLIARLSVTDDPRDGGAVFGPVEAARRGLADVAETRAAFYDRIFAAHSAAPVGRSARAALHGGGAQAAAQAARAVSQI